MVMLEPVGCYFEALRYTMTTLQRVCQVDTILDKHLFDENRRQIPLVEYLDETPKGEPSIPPSVKHLDPSQRHAFDEATTKELAVIQGPPGTGKTFTSVVILQSLVETQRVCHEALVHPAPRRPIIITAQTNHALDQLLMRYMETCGSGAVVRLGSRTSREAIEERTLFNLAKGCGRSSGAGRLHAERRRILRSLKDAVDEEEQGDYISAETLLDAGIISPAQYKSLDRTFSDWDTDDAQLDAVSVWLGDDSVTRPDPNTEAEEDLEREIRDRQANRTFVFGFIPLPVIETSAADEYDDYYSQYMLRREPDLYSILPENRRTVYEYMKSKLKTDKQPLLKALIASYNDASLSLQQAKLESNTAFIQQREIEVVGCTCTGLLKHKDLIAGLEPRILLMEEAAEVREADTMAGVAFPSLEQVILVGDHQQLLPSTSMHELSRDPFRVDLSMFERLVKLVSHSTLLEQRRMTPELRRVVGLFYPDLVDHKSTGQLDQTVPGMKQQSMWWFNHGNPEMAMHRSFANVFEARMIAGFVRYLVASGTKPGKITMLTYYRGQVAALKQALAALQLAPFKWSVRTVDGFQGEENDIIILSLVRGLNGSGPGFVSLQNRAVVALSRARRGLYVFGNTGTLRKNTRSWGTWCKVLGAFCGNSGCKLPIYPSNGRAVNICNPKEWQSVPCEVPSEMQPREICQELSPTQGHSASGKDKSPRKSRESRRAGQSSATGADRAASQQAAGRLSPTKKVMSERLTRNGTLQRASRVSNIEKLGSWKQAGAQRGAVQPVNQGERIVGGREGILIDFEQGESEEQNERAMTDGAADSNAAHDDNLKIIETFQRVRVGPSGQRHKVNDDNAEGNLSGGVDLLT